MLSESGSDWNTINLLAVETDGSARDLPDKCRLVRFSCLTWTLDGLGFFYCKCAPENIAALQPPVLVMSWLKHCTLGTCGCIECIG